MKKFALLALVLCTSVFATEVSVLNVELPITPSYSNKALTSFHMDTKTGEGFAKVAVTVKYYPNTPTPPYFPRRERFPDAYEPIPVVVYEETVKIDGLMLIGDQMIYHGAEGDVTCGKLGLSRVFKKPTLFLNGNCTLFGYLKGQTLRVKLITK